MIKLLKVLALPIGAVACMAFGPLAGIGCLVLLYFGLECLA